MILLVLNPALAKDCRAPGAGILPYSVGDDGKIRLLLAYDKRGFWSNLGGKRSYVSSINEPKPRCETAQETAVREGWEESRYLLSKSFLTQAVSSAQTIPVAPTDNDFVTFVFKVNEISLERYYDYFVIDGSASDETVELAWLDLDSFIQLANGQIKTIQTPNGGKLRSVFWKQFKLFLLSEKVDHVFIIN